MNFKDIIYKIDGEYANITINRPKVYNAYTPETLHELKKALDLSEKNKKIGIIVLSGAGDKAFCSGGDVNWEGSKEFQNHEYKFHIHLTECSKPIIAKVNGYAIGGGNHMAYFCDLTIASKNSIFGQNGPRVGSPAAGAIVAHSANLLGHKRAREMWMTCGRYKAQEMKKWGLVNSVVSKKNLDKEVRKFGDEILKASPTCIKILKASFRKQFESLLKITQTSMVKKIAPNYFKTGEQQEGVRAFKEKRKPNFKKFR
jgi:2-ketocyclohexanecarboxyl-CoA hydrolase